MGSAKVTAIFGVTADPFTVAHRAIVEEVINKKIADHVIIVPTKVSWHRDGKTTWLNDDERCNVIAQMMRCANVGSDKWSVYTREIDRCWSFDDEFVRNAWLRRRRFIDILIDIRAASLVDPHAPFKVIIGQDEFDLFDKWADYESILKLAKLVVVRRGSSDVSKNEQTIPHETLVIGDQYAGVSATDIREKYSNAGKLALTNYLCDVCPNDILIAHTPIFNVVKKIVRDTDFKPIQIQSNDWVTILVKQDEEFVVVKQLRYGLMRPFAEFPCGTVEPGESPMAAAVRELSEETGIELTNAKNDMVYLGKVPTNPAFMTNHMHYFYVDLRSASFKTVKQHLDEHEKIIVGALTIDDLFFRAYNVGKSPALEMPALMCTALFMYDNFRKHPSHYLSAIKY